MTGFEVFWARYGPALLLALGALALSELVMLIWMHLRLKRSIERHQGLIAGTDATNTESLLRAYAAQVQEIGSRTERLDATTQRLATQLQEAVQCVGIVRYNPFADVGGNQSFAIAMTDARGNGFVITSLHHRDRTQIYGKPLAAWSSPYALSDEENHAIEIARNGQE